MATDFVTLRGYNRVRNDLRWLVNEFPQEVDEAVGAFARNERAVLKSTPYPAKRPGQTYVRTGNLANRWQAVREGAGRWAIRNSADYSGWVVGRGTQSWFHAGRWWVAEDIIEQDIQTELTPALTRLLEQRFAAGGGDA